MSLETRALRVLMCDAPDCDAEIVTDSGDAVEARFQAAAAGWGYRPTKRMGSKRPYVERADFCPEHKAVTA